MELKDIVMTIIKILISIPTIVLVTSSMVDATALMGGHFDNTSNSTVHLATAADKDNISLPRLHKTPQGENPNENEQERIPNPSALVLPGYNLPENIFNKGKPFYLEKDPLTGKVDFDSRTSLLLNPNDDDEFDYIDEEPNSSIYDKSNIDRKDGSLSSHKASDVNQLTPNFHDFLNLPVKYNPDKYVYPLISNSYANTKVQGNINKYINHKNYEVSTHKPIAYTVKTPFFHPETGKPTPKTTTASKTLTTTTKPANLINDDYKNNHQTIPHHTTTEIYFTTKDINDIYLTTKNEYISSTTKRPLSIFEQLFGEYDDISTEKPKPPSLFQNLPINKNKHDQTIKPENHNHNILTGTEMHHESAYEYDYDDVADTDNKIYQTKPIKLDVKTTPVISSNTPFFNPTTPSTTSTTMTSTTSSSTPTSSNPVSAPTTSSSDYEYYDGPSEELEQEETKIPKYFLTTTTTESLPTTKVTSLPLGENHFGSHNVRPPIIAVSTQNIRDQLNNEKISHPPIPSSNSIRMSPDQDSVSFVVGHHQNVAGPGGGGGYVVGTSFKEGHYDSKPFKPLIITADDDNKETVSFSIQAKPVFSQSFTPKTAEVGGSSVNIQPIKTSEASLSIGVPINGNLKKIPGQVVNENLESEKIEFPKLGSGAKIVFKDESDFSNSSSSTIAFPTYLAPPPRVTHREVLHLNSKPMYHQLPADLTPPSEQDMHSLERVRPPWDPRPGHFHNGRPEYIRPPRPQQKPGEIFKRIDNLPNILPQFRPNTKHFPHHHFDSKNGYLRQPLLDRPSNKPIGFFEKLIPPPPPKNLHNLRKVPILEQENLRRNPEEKKIEHYDFQQFQTPPPQPILASRRKSEEPTVETLQMIQAKQGDVTKGPSGFKTNLKGKDVTEKPLYVVYPVNSAPIKLDALHSGKKETVVVGTRAELPLPPSKISQEFNYESPKDRHDAPILKPHPKPTNFPIKSDFPYHLERPVAESSDNNNNNIGSTSNNNIDVKEGGVISTNNQWDVFNDAESRIVTGSKINYKNPNQISVTLKTYTEKPIAVAYTPTEPYKKLENTERYSMPNYASPVIAEIRPAGLIDKTGSEITVSAVMHTHSQIDLGSQSINGKPINYFENHRSGDVMEVDSSKKQGFQAPFQASANVDGMTQGWTVVRNDHKGKIDRSDQDMEGTTLSIASTSEFDIENFKPQLFGGFKPLYNPLEDGKIDEMGRTEREERTA